MAEVWLAEHLSNGGSYAIKVPLKSLAANPRVREYFYNEAAAQLNLRHPNIVPAFDLIDDEVLALVLQYVPGASLEEKIYGPDVRDLRPAAGRSLPVDKAIHIGAGILDGLNYAHQRRWIHRDVKPSNILIEESTGRACLTDFGIVRNMGLVGRRSTQVGQFLGTVWYASPEQIIDAHSADHRTDVYSVGVILLEMLAGRPPFDGPTDFAIQAQHVNDSPPSLCALNPGVSSALERLIHTALAKKPAERFSGCGEFAMALETSVRASGKPKPRPAPPVSPAPDSGDRRRLKVAGPTRVVSGKAVPVIVGLVVLLALLAILLAIRAIFPQPAA